MKTRLRDTSIDAKKVNICREEQSLNNYYDMIRNESSELGAGKTPKALSKLILTGAHRTILPSHAKGIVKSSFPRAYHLV